MRNSEIQFLVALTIIVVLFLLGFARLEDRITHLEDQVVTLQQHQPLP